MAKNNRNWEITKSKLVGQTFVEDYEQKLENLSKGDKLDLVWEAQNTHDDFAIAVYTPSGKRIGYLSAKAKRYIQDGNVLDKEEAFDIIRDSGEGLPEEYLNKIVYGMLMEGRNVFAEVLEITGNQEEGQNLGCNIRIVERPKSWKGKEQPRVSQEEFDKVKVDLGLD